MAVTKFQDKFASLRQVNSSSSQDKFQICCTDMCLVEFLANFAVFHMFLSISRDFAGIPEFRGSATARNFRSPEFHGIGNCTRYSTTLMKTKQVVYIAQYKLYLLDPLFFGDGGGVVNRW